MCDTCGCNLTPAHTGAVARDVLKGLLDANDAQAAHNRAHFDRHGVLAINLMSSPGAGKTALLEATVDALRGELRMAVIEGDLETENDAQRIRAKGIPAVQITTGTACHLDAHLVHGALHDLPLAGLDVVFIENVGNLVCPASFDHGQHYNVALLSVTEGDDKPAKYPVMFRAADLVLVTKTDLLDVVDDFSLARARAAMQALGRDTLVRTVATRRRPWIGPWTDWLRQVVEAHRATLRPAPPARPLAPLHA
jgi:hydrogenase nickel incorporation protein HypB